MNIFICIILYIICGLIIDHLFAKWSVSFCPNDAFFAGSAMLLGLLLWPSIVALYLAFRVGQLYTKKEKIDGKE